MMDYVSSANKAIREELARQPLAVVFGQNVAAGSRLGGLARGFGELENCTVLNTPNCENGLVGMGFGLMLERVPSIFMMKQQDFLLLGVDQLFNTWNALRERSVQAPFVICTIVVDSGWEGPQSSFNNSVGLSQLSRVPVFTPASADQLEASVHQAFSGGPAILAVSQRMFRDEAWTPGSEWTLTECVGFSFYAPKDVAATCSKAALSVNFAFPQALEAATRLGVQVAHLWRPDSEALNEMTAWALDFDEVILFDDSKSVSAVGTALARGIGSRGAQTRVRLVGREDQDRWHLPCADQLITSGNF